jgi:hypothetical protein
MSNLVYFIVIIYYFYSGIIMLISGVSSVVVATTSRAGQPGNMGLISSRSKRFVSSQQH